MSKNNTLLEIQKRVEIIEERNIRVEADKAWESSVTRAVLLFGVTYVAVVGYFLILGEEKPFIIALEPAAGVFLSGFIFSRVKRAWISRYTK